MYAFTIINAYGNKTIPVQFYQKTKQNKTEQMIYKKPIR